MRVSELLRRMRFAGVAASLMVASLAGAQNTFDPTMPFTPNAVPPSAVVPPSQMPAGMVTQDGPAPTVQAGMPPMFDYSSNLDSDVFGGNLFTGAFARDGAAQFNPNHIVSVGDQVQVRLWGAFQYESTLTVDPRGNIFLPYVGPIRVVGVRNQDLQRTVSTALNRTFRNNVQSYASLAAAQPVRVFVSGYVHRPGLYNGTSSDSVLQYLDQAGGIDPERGSYLNVQVKRGNTVRARVSLYDFLLHGNMGSVQLHDGDVVFVGARQNTVKVTGLAENAKRFEFYRELQPTVDEIAQMAKPTAVATHVRVTRNTGTTRHVEYYALAEARGVMVGNGDEIEFTADKKIGNITVRVEGEHLSAQEYVLPYGARMGDVLGQVTLDGNSELENAQLFRQSVKLRQKELLNTSLRNLEMSVLSARSSSTEEARLRKEEADLTLQWIERARKVEPLGQVIIANAQQRDMMLLENGDVIRIPRKDDLVLVSGEVLFPNAVAYQQGMSVDEYISRAGGYLQKASNARVVVAKRDGSYQQKGQSGFNSTINAGDQILVLPRVDDKKRQFWKELTQILYQIAVGAKIVFDL
nr:polysaccharide biosynthesis/export family protein [Brachymonas chironomi]